MASVPQSASRLAPFIRWFCALAVTWFAVWASGCSDLDRAQRARVLEVAARAKEDLRQFAMAEQDFVEAGVPADFSYTSDARLADAAALQQLRLAHANGAAEAEVALPALQSAVQERQRLESVFRKLYETKADECRRRYAAAMGTIVAVIATGDPQVEAQVVGLDIPADNPTRPEFVLELAGRPGRFDPQASRARLSEKWRAIWARYSVSQMNRFAPVESVPAALRESEAAIAEFTAVLDLAVSESRW